MWLSPWIIWMTILTSLWADTAPGSEPRDLEVELKLIVAQSDDPVLGDRIPVVWRFTNKSPKPLGFLWEGCCRLNGRLQVSAAGRAIDLIPSAQALAHMFAKAERLDPGISRDFETDLSDWVRLTHSGTYQLGGSYIGVLPSQKPQVPRGLNLWTNRAESQSVSLAVLNVVDYQGQKIAREKAAQLRTTLTGPVRVSPIKKQRYQVAIQNLGSTNEFLQGPDSASIWIVQSTGERRVLPGLNFLDAPPEITVPGGAVTNLDFEIGAESMEGEPFGVYKVFVDLRKGADKKLRVPSNSLPLAWELTEKDVRDLLLAAASGGSTGARNPPLRLLRAHLRQISDILQTILPGTNWSPRALELRGQLHKASRLTLTPSPQGRVAVGIRFDSEGNPAWTDPLMDPVLPLKNGWQQGVTELLHLRRHLGWEVNLSIFPDDSMPLSLATKPAIDARLFAQELAQSPVLRFVSQSQATLLQSISMELVDSSIRSRTFVHVSIREGAVGSRVVETIEAIEGSAPNPGVPPTRESFARTAQELKTAFMGERSGSRTVIVIADPDLKWGELKPWIQALADAGIASMLQLRSSGIGVPQ